MGQIEGWNEDSYRALMVQEKVLGLIGVWPLAVHATVSFRRWILAIIIQVSTICGLTMETYRHCLDAEDTMDAFIMDLSSVVSLSKLIVTRINYQHTYTLIHSVMQDWSAERDERHREIMAKYANKGRIVSLTILCLGYASGISFVLKCIPIETLLPGQIFNIKSSPAIPMNDTFKTKYFLATYCIFGTLPFFPYSLVLAYQATHIFINATSHCGNDGFLFTLVMHLCGQFEILKMNLAEMDTKKYTCQKKFRVLIKRHCRLVMLTDNLEQAFNMMIFVQLLMSALLLCVAGFQFLLALHVKDNVAALKNIIIIVTLLVQLFLYAYAGDILESETQGIAQAVYNAYWYNIRSHWARDITLVILRGSDPHHITAGKFLSMNLCTFREILKTSASYLSVLRVMLES